MKTDAVRLAEFIEIGLEADNLIDRLPVVLTALVGMQGSVVQALRVLYNESLRNCQRGSVAAKVLGVPQELIQTVEEMEFVGMRPIQIVQMLQGFPEAPAAKSSDSSAQGRLVSS